ncbi:cobalamin-binding protein [Alishewanella longhuensis]|uniref:Cobalamin-binding protein n=1 Tax=Alishewanella longhuensis TaxID=1091037 RepID=A0ABQ3L4S1_9ALTE|nr:cobalamin-binding protein [Alishewanella longhuensis]GHG71632.1 cobalamin-binding protein [Alishewanella longhuensis]
MLLYYKEMISSPEPAKRLVQLLVSMLLLTIVLLNNKAQAELGTPQRVISLAPHITELVYAVGAGDKLVAVSDYSDYPAAAQLLPRVNSFAALNIEAILALKPDLVLAWRSGNPPADLARLQQFGVRVEYSDPLLIDDIATELLQIGQWLGQAEQGALLATEIQQRLSLLRASYQQQTPVKVFYAMTTDPLSTVANQAWPAQLLQACGADNIFADAKNDYPQPQLEQLLLRQPEVIVRASKDGSTKQEQFWQRYPSLPAVRKQAFITLEPDWVYRATPRMIDAMQQLCEALQQYREPM